MDSLEEVSPDYSQATDNVTPGQYVAQIIGCKKRIGRNSGAAYLQWSLVANDDTQRVLPLIYNTPLEGRGAVFLRGFLQQVDPGYREGKFHPDDFIGKTLIVKVDYPVMPDGRKSAFPRITQIFPNARN